MSFLFSLICVLQTVTMVQLCFLRQFRRSIKKSDYMALRLGFITVRTLTSLDCFNFPFRCIFILRKCLNAYDFLHSSALCLLVNFLISTISCHTRIISTNTWYGAWKMIIMEVLASGKTYYFPLMN